MDSIRNLLKRNNANIDDKDESSKIELITNNLSPRPNQSKEVTIEDINNYLFIVTN